MKLDLILFFFFFGAATIACIALNLLLFAMIDRVNQKKDDHSQFRYFFLSWTWTKVWREYKLLYPKGAYSRALIALIATWGIFSLLTAVYLFGVLSKYALPSR
jgi:hypothetical protein